MPEVNITNLLHLGIEAHEAKNYPLAESYLLDILYTVDDPSDPHYVRATYALAMNYIVQGNETGASRCFEQARIKKNGEELERKVLLEEVAMIRTMLESFADGKKWEVANFLVQQEEAFRETNLSDDAVGFASLYRLGAIITANLHIPKQTERYLSLLRDSLHDPQVANELPYESYQQFLKELESFS